LTPGQAEVEPAFIKDKDIALEQADANAKAEAAIGRGRGSNCQRIGLSLDI
jgi:hypothetical protein